MPQGDKGKYTSKQKRKAEHIEEGYENRGTSHKELSDGPGRPGTSSSFQGLEAGLYSARTRTWW
jgi:hypothetical protein